MSKSSSIKIDPEILGGTPCFSGTRVPVKILFDYLEGGDTLDQFLAQYPAFTAISPFVCLKKVRRHCSLHNAVT